MSPCGPHSEDRIRESCTRKEVLKIVRESYQGRHLYRIVTTTVREGLKLGYTVNRIAKKAIEKLYNINPREPLII